MRKIDIADAVNALVILLLVCEFIFAAILTAVAVRAGDWFVLGIIVFVGILFILPGIVAAVWNYIADKVNKSNNHDTV